MKASFLGISRKRGPQRLDEEGYRKCPHLGIPQKFMRITGPEGEFYMKKEDVNSTIARH
mgnify:CR=1 FL=1